MMADIARRLATLIAVGALVGCSSQKAPSQAIPVTTASTVAPVSITSTTIPAAESSTTAADTTKADIETAYRNAVRSVQEAGAIPDPDYSSLAIYNTGPMLDHWREVLTKQRTGGLVARFPVNSVAHVIVRDITPIDATTVVVSACEVDDGQIVEQKTGRVVNDAVSSADQRATMLLVDSTWRLSARELLQKRAGVSC